VEGTQVLKPESVARRHGRACHFADAYGMAMLHLPYRYQ
jgi:hypothetical protein